MKTKTYKLRDAKNQEIQSPAPGEIGGHKKLKIYGRLDCPNALRWIDRGHYVQHRVFFRDEQTARSAGYRPCGCCMPKEYRAWKDAQK